MIGPVGFGPWLRRERERRGIALKAIADHTKVSASLFQALERDDLSRWPGGIYRRAFVRAYAEYVGLDPTEVLRRFERFFPDPESAVPQPQPPGTPAAAAAAPDASPDGGQEERPRLHIVLDEDEGSPPRAPARGARRPLVAAADLAVPALIGLAVAAAIGASAFWLTVAVSALAYQAIGTLIVGASPALWWLRDRREGAASTAASAEAPAARRTVRSGMPSIRDQRREQRRLSRQARRARV